LHNSKDPVDGNGKRQMLIGQMLQKNTTRPQKVTGRGTRINSKYVGIVVRNHYLIFM
jgi:hypothetical protein